MLQDGLLAQLNTAEQFFLKTIEGFTQDNALFKPQDDLYTVTAHIDHTAHTVSWFIDGAFRNETGFDLDFEQMIEDSHNKTDFAAAKTRLKEAFADARNIIQAQSDENLMTALPDGPIMGGAPKLAIIPGIVDHTAHHRGALAVYCRLLGKVPAMPYE